MLFHRCHINDGILAFLCVFSNHAQVVCGGLTVNKVLEVTHSPCHKKHLYKRVKAEQDRLVTMVREGAMAVLVEVLQSIPMIFARCCI